MNEVAFKDLKVGDTFFITGIEYKKIEEKRISCCKRLNAESVADPRSKMQVNPLTLVQIKAS